MWLNVLRPNVYESKQPAQDPETAGKMTKKGPQIHGWVDPDNYIPPQPSMH